MKRAKQGPGVVNALMQGAAHAVRDMGACEDQCEKMEGTPGGKRQRSGQKEGGLKTMVLRAAAHKSHLPPKGSTTRDAVARRSSERCI